MKRPFIGFLALLLIGSACLTKTESRRRRLDEVIFDSVKLLKSDQAESLYSSITKIENQFGSQLAIVIVDSVRGKSIEEYSLQTIEKLELGRNKYRDGLLIALVISQRKARIEVGNGLEKIITDEIAGRIFREQLRPHFKEGDYFLGLQAGIEKVKEHISKSPQLIGKSLRDK